MPLTIRTNGSSSTNIIQASWFNDFANLFTGNMQDQPITFLPNVTVRAISIVPAAGMTATAVSGSGLGTGVYQYTITFLTSDGGESTHYSTPSVTTTSGNNKVNVTLIPTGPTGCAARKIYRTKVGGSTFFLLATLNDNTTTSYTDTTADASLGTANPPAHSSFGGTVSLTDASSVDHLWLTSDGTVIFDPVPIQTEAPQSLWIGSASGATNPDLVIANYGAGFIVFRSGAKTLSLRDQNNATWGTIFQSGNLMVLSTPGSGPIGFRNGNGRLAEARGDGNFVINGTTYNTGGTGFDGFDIAEVYQMDQEYPAGTIVCPTDPTTTYTDQTVTPTAAKCSHDACPLALPVSATPGFIMGYANQSSQPEYYDSTKPITQPVALNGRVFLKTAYNIAPKSYVTSDGRGGVRAVVAGESVYAIGVSFGSVNNGLVPVLIRPMHVTL